MTRGINYLCRAHYYLSLFDVHFIELKLSMSRRRKCYLRWGLKAKENFSGRTFLSISLVRSQISSIWTHKKGHRDPFFKNLPLNMIASALSSLQSYQYLPHHHLTLNKFTPSLISLSKAIDCVNKCESCKEINLEIHEIWDDAESLKIFL